MQICALSLSEVLKVWGDSDVTLFLNNFNYSIKIELVTTTYSRFLIKLSIAIAMCVLFSGGVVTGTSVSVRPFWIEWSSYFTFILTKSENSASAFDLPEILGHLVNVRSSPKQQRTKCVRPFFFPGYLHPNVRPSYSPTDASINKSASSIASFRDSGSSTYGVLSLTTAQTTVRSFLAHAT